MSGNDLRTHKRTGWIATVKCMTATGRRWRYPTNPTITKSMAKVPAYSPALLRQNAGM